MIGDEVRVRLERVDVDRKHIDFEVAEMANRGKGR
jgi:exoribonuclease R